MIIVRPGLISRQCLARWKMRHVRGFDRSGGPIPLSMKNTAHIPATLGICLVAPLIFRKRKRRTNAS
jgi:hypothetical protein